MTCQYNCIHLRAGSNLFKACAPAHGIVLFKHHDPLAFDQEQLSDLLDAAWLWLVAASSATQAKQQPPQQEQQLGQQEQLGKAPYPFLLWNCLPRAGASQFHGHAQVSRGCGGQCRAVREVLHRRQGLGR